MTWPAVSTNVLKMNVCSRSFAVT